VVIEEVSNSLKAGEKLIAKLGLEKYVHNKIVPKQMINETYSSYDYNDMKIGDYDLYGDEEELDEVSESITELVLSMDKQGYDPEEIKDEVSKYLIDNDLYV